MNTATQNTTTTFLSENKKGLVILFVLFLLSSVGMFGQTTKDTVAPVTTSVIEINTNPVQAVAFDSDNDFMNWFMGSKHTQSLQEDASVGSTTTSRKKQSISSGVIPNKVLYRTFVKKVISQESAIA